MRHRDNSTPQPTTPALEVTTPLARVIGASVAVHMTTAELHSVVDALEQTRPPGRDLMADRLRQALREHHGIAHLTAGA
jgi:hypothetical protein